MILLSDTTTTTWKYWNTCLTSTAVSVDYATSTWAEWSATWVAASVTSTTATISYAWVSWNENWTCDFSAQLDMAAVPARTPEQIQADVERDRRLSAEEQERYERAMAEADARAEALLRENLSAAQVEEFNRDRMFTVISRDGERRYRIRKGWSQNIERIDIEGKKMHTLCAHPNVGVPHYDNMLAQKLLLEHDEEYFLKTANRSA